MENIRTSTLILHNKNKQSIQHSQQNISRVTDQVTSGVESRDFEGISHKTSIESHLINKNIAQTLQKRIGNNELLTAKLSSIENNVMGMQDAIRDGLVLAVRSRTAGPNSGLDTELLAKQGLGRIRNLLQGQFNGQYLFSGTDTRTMPVTDFVTTSNIVAGNITGNYYLGNNDSMTSKISEGNQISYGLRANDAAVQKMIGAYHKMVEGYSLNDPTKYQEAVDLFNEAKVGLSNYIAGLGNDYAAVDEQIKLDKDLQIKLKERIAEVESVDVPTAMADLVNNQVQLQAAYTLLVRANSITLADYLH